METWYEKALPQNSSWKYAFMNRTVLLRFCLIFVRCPAVFSVSYYVIMRAVTLVKRNVRSNVNCFVSRNMALLSLCDNVHFVSICMTIEGVLLILRIMLLY